MDELNDKIDISVWDGWKEFEQVESEPGFFLTLVDVFLASVPQDFVALLAEIDAVDLNRIFQISHSLKSSCRSLGAMSLGDGFERLEIQARRSIPPESQTVLALKVTMASVIGQLEQERRSLRDMPAELHS